MKKWFILASVAAIIALAPLAGAQEKAAPPAGKEAPKAPKSAFKTQKEKVSYCIGMDLGRTIKQLEIDVDVDLVARAVKDILADKPAMTDQEVHEVMTALSAEIRAKQNAKMQEMSDKNKKAGEDFLADNAKKDGVKTLPSGLQYKVVAEGAGKVPGPKDTVSVNYKGTLIDGKVFDSSEQAGAPATFQVDEVIAGWTEALQLMKVGAKWQIFAPSKLAYGERGNMGIEPNSTLIFDVELISIGPAPEVKLDPTKLPDIKPEPKKDK